MLQKPQLTPSQSKDFSQRSFPFINAANEKIPPFSAMQIVGNPDKWRDFVARRDVSSWEKAVKKVENVATSFQFDNGMQLWCDKPSEFTELLQDSSIVAFNGDSEVDKDSGGRCFYSEYPMRAVINGSPSLSHSYALKADAWHLSPTLGKWGAFRAFCDTQQAVSITDKTVTPNQTRNMSVVNICNYRNDVWKPSIKGQWDVDGSTNGGKFPITIASPVATYVEIYAGFSDFIGFGLNPTLTFRVPGIFSCYFNGDIRVKNPPSNLNTIPFKLGLEPWNSDDKKKYSSQYYPDRDAFPVWQLQKFMKDSAGNITPLSQGQVAPPGSSVRWSRTKFSYSDALEVKVGGARLVMYQDGSPFVQGGGTFTSILDNDPTGTTQRLSTLYFVNSNPYYWGLGGWYWNGFNTNGPISLPEGIVTPYQFAFPYFHTDDPWVPV